MDVGKTFEPQNRADWRGWLERNHGSETEIWLVSRYKATGKPSLPYADAVQEALCFGWIDSTNKRIDDEQRAQRFTPRRNGSPWSELNKARVRQLAAAGLMTQAGLDAGVDFLDETFEMPVDILEAFKQEPEAWAHFQTFPEAYVRIRIGWVDSARDRPEEFQKRLAYFLKMTKLGKLYGMEA